MAREHFGHVAGETDAGLRVIVVGDVGAGIEYLAHYHTERNHQGLGNELNRWCTAAGRRAGRVALPLTACFLEHRRLIPSASAIWHLARTPGETR
jgi:hypothetical protein